VGDISSTAANNWKLTIAPSHAVLRYSAPTAENGEDDAAKAFVVLVFELSLLALVNRMIIPPLYDIIWGFADIL